MHYLISFLPILIMIITTFFYAYFFVALGNYREILLAVLGFVSGFVFIFLAITYFDIWGIFLSSIVLMIGTLNILQIFHTLPKIKEAQEKRQLKISQPI